MSKIISAVVVLLFGAFTFATTTARAADADHTLLATFCAPADIQGPTCKRAKGYPNAGGRGCDALVENNCRQSNGDGGHARSLPLAATGTGAKYDG